jgi:uncharacterized protein with FMN-binding domain
MSRPYFGNAPVNCTGSNPKRTPFMNRKLTALIFTALVGPPVAGVLTASPAAAANTQSSKTHTYKGTTVQTTWGPMQVVISVKGKKITKIKAVDPTHTSRSLVLADRAVPVLIQETLSAQSARIDAVSGATTISQAYVSSLQSALKRAHLA